MRAHGSGEGTVRRPAAKPHAPTDSCRREAAPDDLAGSTTPPDERGGPGRRGPAHVRMWALRRIALGARRAYPRSQAPAPTVMHRLPAHRLTQQRGQSSIEYLGIIAVVAAIVGVIIAAAPDFGRDIVNAIGSQIEKVLGG